MIFLLVYFFDVINSVAREAIPIGCSDCTDHDVGTKVAVTFGVLGGIFIIISIILLIYNICIIFGKCNKGNSLELLLIILESFGVLFYFYGDNVKNVTNNYGEALVCNNDCRKIVKITSTISLGVSIVVLYCSSNC